MPERWGGVQKTSWSVGCRRTFFLHPFSSFSTQFPRLRSAFGLASLGKTFFGKIVEILENFLPQWKKRHNDHCEILSPYFLFYLIIFHALHNWFPQNHHYPPNLHFYLEILQLAIDDQFLLYISLNLNLKKKKKRKL